MTNVRIPHGSASHTPAAGAAMPFSISHSQLAIFNFRLFEQANPRCSRKYFTIAMETLCIITD